MVPHREDVYLGDLRLFKDYLVLEERAAGAYADTHAPVGQGDALSHFDEPAFRASCGQPIRNSIRPVLRFEFTSMKTPVSIYDYDMSTRQRTLLKREEVLGGFDSDHYITERLHVRAADGAEIPLSFFIERD